MLPKLFSRSLRRIGLWAAGSASSLSAAATVTASTDDPPPDFYQKWQSALEQWDAERLREESPPSEPSEPPQPPRPSLPSLPSPAHLQRHPLETSANAYEYDLKLLEDMADDFVIFHGTNCIELTEEVACILQKKVSTLNLGRYADGEISVRLGENVRGKSVYIIQSTSRPVHENVMELLLAISAARRASALRICAIVPYYGYSRADRRRSGRNDIAASDLAHLFEAMGLDQMVTVDLHRRQLQGCFEETNVDVLESLRAVLPVLLEKDLFHPVICCASDTGVFRAKKLQKLLMDEGIPSKVAFVTSARASDKMIEFQEMHSHHRISNINQTEVIGDVRHSDVIVLDDMIDTGSRLINAARKCKEEGAFRIFAFATHGIFSDDCLQRVNECDELDEVFVTNTIYPPRIASDADVDAEMVHCGKLSFVSVGPIIAEAIRRMQIRNTLSSMTHIDCP